MLVLLPLVLMGLFVYTHDGHLVFLLLYVDDIIVTGNHPSLIASLIATLGQDLDLKDLGKLHYFLGLQFDYTSTRIFVHQSKYATDLLHKFSMSECKPCKTPCIPNAHLVANDSPLLHDPTAYRSMVGHLPLMQLNYVGYVCCSGILVFFFIPLLLYGMIMYLLWPLLVILFFMLGPSILKWITTLFVRRFSIVIFRLNFFSSHDQLADFLTKGLPSPRFHWLVSKLMWCFPKTLRGDEEQSYLSLSNKPSDEPNTSSENLSNEPSTSSESRNKDKPKPNSDQAHCII